MQSSASPSAAASSAAVALLSGSRPLQRSSDTVASQQSICDITAGSSVLLRPPLLRPPRLLPLTLLPRLLLRPLPDAALTNP